MFYSVKERNANLSLHVSQKEHFQKMMSTLKYTKNKTDESGIFIHMKICFEREKMGDDSPLVLVNKQCSNRVNVYLISTVSLSLIGAVISSLRLLGSDWLPFFGCSGSS